MDEKFNNNDLKTHSKVFVESSYKEEELRSSVTSFFIVIGILIVLDILIYLDIIPIATNSTALKVLDMSVVALMAVIFLIIALVSMKKVKKVSADSANEAKLTEEIVQYCKNNYIEPVVDGNTSENDIYFEREAVLKRLISDKYPDIDDAYMEYLIETIYSQLYSE